MAKRLPLLRRRIRVDQPDPDQTLMIVPRRRQRDNPLRLPIRIILHFQTSLRLPRQRLTRVRGTANLPPPRWNVSLVRFSQIRGHRAQISALERLVTRGTPGHAYLFEGPEGVGKDTVAQALLTRLACTQTDKLNPEPCGQCSSCLGFLRGDHPDVTRLERDGATIRIDPVRAALKRLRYEPVLGAIKGLIIESAELLREEAANALLKTLEEPSGSTIFVLVTSKPQLLLSTIRSRCQTLRFSSLSPTDVAAILMAEGQPADMAGPASALADGSLTLGRTLCHEARMNFVDYVVAFALNLGLQPGSEAAAFVESLGPRLVGIRAEEGEGKGKDITRADLPWILEIVRTAWRDALLVAHGTDARTLPHARAHVALQALADRADAGKLIAAIDAAQKVEERLNLNPNPKLALTALLVEAGTRLRR